MGALLHGGNHVRRCAFLFVVFGLFSAISPLGTAAAAGAPRVATDAFRVDCAESGQARWLTSREWVYDFDRDLPAGIRCAFVTAR